MSGVRRLVLLPLALLILGAVVATAADQPGWQFTSRPAQAAKRKFEEAAAKADQEYSRRVGAPAETAIKELGEAMRSATRAGDLEEATRIKRAIAELNEEAEWNGGGRNPVGRWDVRYSNGVDRQYDIRPDGAVSWTDGDKHRGQGRLERMEGCWFMAEDGNGNAERIAVACDRLYIEHFHPATRYPKEATRTFAVGTRVDKKAK